MSRYSLNFGFFTSLMAAVVSTAGAVAATDIRLHERVVAASPVVRLGDVAEITTADRARARQLAALPLMPSPAAGTERFLRKREVEDLLVAHGQNMGDLRIDGAVQVSVTASQSNAGDAATNNRQAALLAGRVEPTNFTGRDKSATRNGRDEFHWIIESYLSAKSSSTATWRVSCDVADRYAGLLDTATSPPVCRGGREPWTGRQRFVVSFETARGTVHVPIYADVENLSNLVVVAVRPIARGDVFTAANVEVQNVPAPVGTTGRRAPVTDMEKVIGMEARHAIREGQVVFNDQVQPMLMLKRGELVAITSQTGGIRVRTTARARQDGVKGELIQVESLESRERYDVRVVGPNEAAVFAVSPPNAPKTAERTAQQPIAPKR